jgi:hypothetical protein
MRLKLISCEVFSREMATAISRSVNEVDAEFLPPAPHRRGCGQMRQVLQEALDRVNESNYHAVLFAYGLCHQGVLGLRSRSIPLVLPRAEDCSVLLRGGKPRYLGYAPNHPAGQPPPSPGGLGGLPDRRGCRPRVPHGAPPGDGIACCAGDRLPDDPLHPAAAAWDGTMPLRFSSTEVDNLLGAADYVQFQAEKEAEWFGWDFEKAMGDLHLIQRFLDGFWSHNEFLVVPPGFQIAAGQGQEMFTAKEIHA